MHEGEKSMQKGEKKGGWGLRTDTFYLGLLARILAQIEVSDLLLIFHKRFGWRSFEQNERTF